MEGRLNSGMPGRLREGDTLRLQGGRDHVRVAIKKVQTFKNFPDMIEAIGVTACLPDYHSVDAAVRLYRSFPGYARKEKQFGCVALHLRVLDDV